MKLKLLPTDLYFDQRLGAAQPKRWSNSAFLHFWHVLQVFDDLWFILTWIRIIGFNCIKLPTL